MTKPYVPQARTCEEIQRLSNELTSTASLFREQVERLQVQQHMIERIARQASYISEFSGNFTKPSSENNYTCYGDVDDVINYHSAVSAFYIKEETLGYNNNNAQTLAAIETLREEFCKKTEELKVFLKGQTVDNNHSL